MYQARLAHAVGARDGRSVAMAVGHPVNISKPDLRRPGRVGQHLGACLSWTMWPHSYVDLLAPVVTTTAWGIVADFRSMIEILEIFLCPPRAGGGRVLTSKETACP